MRKYLLGVAAIAVMALGAVSAVITGASQAAAIASTTKTVTNDANTLKISPVRTDLSIKPGQTGTVKMTITNLTGSPQTVQPIENDFIAGDENGTPALILDASKYAPTHSLKRFMQPIGNVTVPAHSTSNVMLSIKVPANAQAGGYFGAVRFTPVGANGNEQVNLSASAASIVLMTVPGALVEQLSLNQFTLTQNGSSVGSFLTGGKNVAVNFKFTNQGNVQVAPFGQIYVKRGDKVVYSSNFNQTDPRAMVLPDSARKWTVPLKDMSKFGHYTIGATFTYGTTNKSIDITKTIWVIPLAYIIGAVVALVILILIIVAIVYFTKRRMRRGARARKSKQSGGGLRL